MVTKAAEMPPAAPEGTALTVAAGLDPQMAGLMKIALEKGTVDSLEKLVALAERVENRNAAREFASALAEFQEKCPPIVKNRSSKEATGAGSNFSYTYAPLDQIARSVRPVLHALGLSYSFDSSTVNGIVTVVCTLRHVNGHRESSKFEAPIDQGGRMNGTQKVGSALSYGKRYALISILGLSTCEEDDDGAGGRDAGCITPKQAADFDAMLDEFPNPGEVRAKFLALAGVEKVEDIRAKQYRALCAALAAKRKGSAA